MVFGCGPTVATIAINAVNVSKGHSGNPASRSPSRLDDTRALEWVLHLDLDGAK